MTDFAKDVQERWKAAEEADKENRDEAVEDLAFAAGEQWDSRVKEYREENGPFPLPCLTINTLPQFIGQVVGDRRANQTSIKVLPREDGDVKIAEIRSELVRSIEIQSKADRVYANTFEAMVTCGLSNFRIDMDYAYEDAFERDLFIRAIPNPMAVQWDPYAGDPTGRDAQFCFVTDNMPKDEFKRRFPKASQTSFGDAALKEAGWITENSVRVAEDWKVIEKDRTIALMRDGTVQDVTKQDEKDYKELLFRGADGKQDPRIRKAKCKYATMVFTNGQEELSDPYELKIPRLPIIRCTGREVWIGDKRVRFGLVRFARDPQRLKNYWRSVIAEQLMSAPRDNYMAPASAVQGRLDDWPGTRVYNDEASGPPIPVFQQTIAALLNEAQMCSQDMKETTGIHEAELGMKSNETSGVAIRQRQQQGDLATIIYHDNMNSSMQEAGELLNALIPIVYDTARTIRTVGADDGVKLLRVNDPNNPQEDGGHIDLAMGRYDVTVTTGPAYATRRQEGAAQLMQLAAQDPNLIQVAGDLIVGELDIPGGDKIAERVKRAIPPQVLGDDADDGKSDEEKQAQAQAAQEAQQKQQAMEQLQFQGAQADTALKIAQAKKAEAEAMKAQAEAQNVGNDNQPAAIDPIEAHKANTAAYDAHTRRLNALGKNDFALPPEATSLLATAVTNAVLQALGHGGLSPADGAAVAAGSLQDGINERTSATANTQSAVNAANEQPEAEGEAA